MDFFETMSLGWVQAIIGLGGILIGTFVTILIYKISRVGPRPVYQSRALRLIGRKEQELPKDVKVFFRDKRVKRLTKTHVILWNSGRAHIDGKNIVSIDPPRLEFDKDAEILSAQVVKRTRETNKFTVNINPDAPNELFCNFDYLEAGDGVTVEILHTGAQNYPEVLGSIRGIPKGLEDWGIVFPPPKPRMTNSTVIFLKIYSIIGLALGLLSTAAGLLAPVIDKLLTSKTETPIGARLTFIIFGLIIAIFCSLYLRVTRRRFPKSLSIEDAK
jgi:hypothetical protein